ncbi:MAG: hypothetical protein AAGF95_28780 [Chloroflexota bacterium]
MSDMSDNLDDCLQEYYHKQSLDPHSLAQLKSLIDHEQPEQTIRRSPLHWIYTLAYRPVGLVGLGMVIMLLTVSIFYWFDTHHDAESRTEMVVSEIVLNHRKRFTPEFTTSNIPDLSSEMLKLDFAPIYPDRVKQAGLTVDGARYCSIDDAIAVQVHMVDAEGKEYTLYQFRDSESFGMLNEMTTEVAGFQVDIWRESDLVLGFVSQSS